MSLEEDKIIRVDIDQEMRNSYRDYATSVIVARALPDVRDGFKPVHRRVLYGMHELGLRVTGDTKKCARVVGEVLGKYHPHGDSSVYGTLVRLAQDWNMRYMLVRGQGNFGSVDGDEPAAMRYTEAKLEKISDDILIDLEKETVDFQDNFDGEFQEPTVMPTRVPNLIINGASGIAVGMATEMPPHNIADTIDACVAFVRNEQIEDDELIRIIKAPDFPTGGTIVGYNGVRDAYLTGKGRILIKSRAEIVNENGRDKIVVTEIPYQVNKRKLIEQIADLANDKKVEGISNVNDETDATKGLRIVIDIKNGANANVVLNKLMKMSMLQSAFNVNSIAIVNGRPKLLTLRDQISEFIKHRMDVVIRRSQFELRKAKERIHLLEGFIIAVDNIDLVIKIIRGSKTTAEAIAELQNQLPLDEIQAKAIVEMRLRQLTGLEIENLRKEYDEVLAIINRLEALLANEGLRRDLICEELIEVKEKYKDERRTDIDYAGADFNPEDFYADEDMVITISHLGYLKSTPLAEYRTQARGGVGSKASNSRDEDFIEYIYQASMHDTLLLFSQKGKCYWLRVYEIQPGAKNSKGRALQNLIRLEPDDRINAFVKVRGLNDKEYVDNHYLVFCTKQGVVKRTCLEQYSRPRTNGVAAISIREDDEVINVVLTDGKCDIVIASRNGRAVRFKEESDLRPMGRTATGVRGMQLDEDDPEDRVIGMVCIEPGSKETLLVVSETGYGKRSYLDDRDENGEILKDEEGNPVTLYRITKRGGKGVRTLNVTEKTGKLVAIEAVTDENDLMIINTSGIAIRLKISETRVLGRAAQGVKLINLSKKNDKIASACKVTAESESEEDAEKAEVQLDENGNSIVPSEVQAENNSAETSDNETAENDNNESQE